MSMTAATAALAAKKTGAFVVKNKKTVLIAAGVLVAIIVIWCVSRHVKKMIRGKIIKEGSENYTGETITPGMEHGALAARIAYACKGPGTDEAEIYSVLGEMRTQADWELMQRTWREVMINLSKFNATLANLIYGIKMDLITTLKSELTRKELQKCREILQGKGINPGF